MSWFDFLFPIKLGDAEFVVVQPNSGRRIPIRFILDSYRLVEQNDYAEVSVPGLSGELIQFVKGRSQILSLTLYFDTRDSGRDVRQEMDDIAKLMIVLADTHAPPVLQFAWKSIGFNGVLVRRTDRFHSLFADGRPSRGTMHVTLREFKTQRQLLEELRRE